MSCNAHIYPGCKALQPLAEQLLNPGAPRGVSLGNMRTFLVSCLVVGAVTLASARTARADELAGTYSVKFEEVATNCDQHKLTYPQWTTLKIEVKGSELQVDIERTPLMVGRLAKPGKVSATSPRPKHTPIQGMDGVFSIAGRVTREGMVSLVMVGEYQTGGKPLCTQSWNLSGQREADKPAKPDKKK
jgi:hypothetical protein